MVKRLIPEWEPQRFVQMTWPHQSTDWASVLDEAKDNFVRIANEITKHELLLIVAPDIKQVMCEIEGRLNIRKVVFAQLPSNDTWARDHGGLTVEYSGLRVVMDFCFNGWGMKFAADKDNLITSRLAEEGFLGDVMYGNCRDFVLEGGSIETDGKGTLLTTSRCLLSPNRNGAYSKEDIEERLKQSFGVERILWLDYGALAGDDTDSHIDTLARLCPDDTIMFQGCQNGNDEHFAELAKMKEQLESFRTLDGKPYRLVELPMPDARYDEDGMRLPASYANYLIVNGAVLVPTYSCNADAEALARIAEVYNDREIVGVDCCTLITQHGSLHCVTMQY